MDATRFFTGQETPEVKLVVTAVVMRLALCQRFYCQLLTPHLPVQDLRLIVFQFSTDLKAMPMEEHSFLSAANHTALYEHYFKTAYMALMTLEL